MGRRSKLYRFFEMVPALISIGAVALLVVLSLINPVLAAIYMLVIASTVLVKAAVTAYHMIKGRRHVTTAEHINWHHYLADLEQPHALDTSVTGNRFNEAHHENMQRLAQNPSAYPKPSEVYNAVIVATYNEPYEVLRDTLQTVADTTYDNQRLYVVLAYEERGGEATEETAQRLRREFAATFRSFDIVKHPKDLPNEVVGKGGNITYAGRWLAAKLAKEGVPHENVIVTTLDSDNRPHRMYFDHVTYEFIVHEERKRLSYQPVSLFLNNIWDVPAPMRVVATGNSFWNIICTVRPHMLRNFASHAQPLDALVEMDFWSTRTIVEDGHQYWRSYFHFRGDYDVVPIFVPIYQDAVLSSTYLKTLKAQFIQLRRWAYGASDVPYVATRVLVPKHRRMAPFWPGFSRLVRLLDGHVTLACIPVLVAFGGWVPWFVNPEAIYDVAANQLPEVLGLLQRIAMIGLVIMVFLSYKMLPPRPARYKRRRNLWMILQWVIMPLTALAYSSTAAYYSQTRLLLGKYLDTFDVTEKATAVTVEQEKARRRKLQKLRLTIKK